MVENRKTKWRRLDNAAKIFPAVSDRRDERVFRFACELKEEVNPEFLQEALDEAMKMFPMFLVVIRKGFFWNYLDGIKKRFRVYKDNRLPCSYINVSNFGKQAFKALYYQNRISVEYFHVLTELYSNLSRKISSTIPTENFSSAEKN